MLRSLRRWFLAALAVAVGLPVLLVLAYRLVPVPVTPLMLLRDAPVDRRWVALEDIAPALPRAVIAAEDNLFCGHWGIDWRSLSAAVEAYAEGERAGGGSTITMQTAKNLFLWPGRHPVRKAIEFPLTLLIELLWPKRRILEVYLNVVEWGDGIYGAEAAARHHFGKPARDLTASEAARLAAVLPNPLKWSAGRPGDYVLRRAATIRRRVGQLGPLLDCAPGA
ncbi:monofunctional biosynthetic peptidoglycan transglycosylase [Thalassobaculum sp.]|uniref:monofunctional biosynthetic peptidoglycan transglycosylase n=1 Tax=Thalassobaculum sp. TaxID=2022740 RepID=UPI0032EE5EBE